MKVHFYYGTYGTVENGKCKACNAPIGRHHVGCRPAEVKPVLSVIGNLMTVRVTAKDARELRFYYHSKVRLCVVLADTLLPEVWFMNGKSNLLSVGMATVQELGEFLLSIGARQVRKPRPLKRSYPLYD